MKKLRKITATLLIATTCVAVAACQPGTTTKTNTPSETEVKTTAPKAGEEGQTSAVSKADIKEKVRENMHKWAKATKEVFVDRSEELMRGFDNSKNQILLVSSANDMALLVNSQNKDVAPPDEIVEYSAKSLEATAMKGLTSGFSTMEFNGHKTYVFNADFWAEDLQQEDLAGDIFEKIYKPIVHEGIHLLLQQAAETAESTMMGSRSETQDMDVDPRYYRNEMAVYLKEALGAEGDQRSELIGKAMYFYNKFKEASGDEKTGFDLIEGQATYLEEKAYQMTQHKDADQAALLKATIAGLIKNPYEGLGLDEATMMAYNVVSKSREPYTIGSLIIALLEQDGVLYEKDSKTLAEQLLSRYSPVEAAGHEGLREYVAELYGATNSGNSDLTKEYESYINNSDYKKVLIPLIDHTASVSYDSAFLAYDHEGNSGNLVTTSQEVNHPNGNRIRLKSAKAFEYYPEDIGDSDTDPFGYVLLYVHKDDIRYEDGKITIQKDDVLMFDTRAKEVDGGYEILPNS